MALWQYTFQILPKKSFSVLKRDIKLFDENNLFDDEPYWEYEPINKNYFDEIGEIIQEGKSWSENRKQYGSLESNCFEILFDNQTNNVESVSFRIDFTSEFELVLRGIIDFCHHKELIILDEQFHIVPLNYEVAKSTIDNAPQVKKYNELKNNS